MKEYFSNLKVDLLNNLRDFKSRKTIYKQVPNMLTLSRAVGMIPINMLFLNGLYIPAIVLTGIILSTDFFDGRIARKWNIQSKFGADLDAVCDKLMFLGLSFPLLIINPMFIYLFLYEGLISLTNVIGRINGLNTKTVFSGKIKTWFLSLAIISSYASEFLNFSGNISSNLIYMTIGAQSVAFCNYLRAYYILSRERKESITTKRKVNESDKSNDLKKEKSSKLCLSRSKIEQLKKERDFYLGIKDKDNIEDSQHVLTRAKE